MVDRSAQVFPTPVSRGVRTVLRTVHFWPRNKWCKSSGLWLSTKSPQSRALENIGPERPLSGHFTAVLVDSPSRITLENNGKIRAWPDGEKLSAKASGGGNATGVQPSLGRKSLIYNEARSHHGTRIRFRRISAANIWPNLFHQNRTVSWLISMPRSCSRSSALRRDSGYRMYNITASRMISGDVLK